MEPQPYYDDADQHAGWLHEAEDGAIIATDLQDNIIGAAMRDGTPLDASAYQMDVADGYEDVRQDVAELQAFRQEQEQAMAQQHQQQPDPYPGVIEDIDTQMNSLTKVLGRDLTMSETKRLVETLSREVRAGRTPDISWAAETLEAEGTPLYNIDDREQRVAWMAERAQENAREADGEDLTQPQPPRRELYDTDDRQERLDWMADRLEGRLSDDDAHASAYSSSELDA